MGGEVGRGEWGNHCEYFLTALGFAVGLGNVWRFPYVAYNNGGGTFLIPYFLCLLLLGIPLFFMENVLGQYTGTSATKIFPRLVPGLGGLGYGLLCIPTMIAFYYTVIMAWAFYFMFQGMRGTLPWTSCLTEQLNDFSTSHCFTKKDNDDCEITDNRTTFFNKTCMDKNLFCEENGFLGGASDDVATCCDVGRNNCSIPISDVTYRISASEEFFKRKMLGQTMIGVVDTWGEGGGSYGSPQWEVIGCLALSWTLVAITLVKGMQSYGKVVYFITLFPYIVLTTFLIMGLQQDGFATGITDYYLNPDWERLYTDFDIWVDACTQIFYTLGVANGAHILLSSYNSFNSNCHRDAVLIGVANSLTSFYAGFIVFGTLGMLAEHNGVAIEDVITQGEGLVFQVYPEAIAQLPVPPLFNFLFFLMLSLLAMSSVVGTWEPIVGAILDEFPKLRSYRTSVYFVTCFLAFLGGISCCFPSGSFMFQLLNDHTGTTILYFGIAELIIVAWLYGIRNFMTNVTEMRIPMPTCLKYFWMLCWAVIAPLICLAIFVIGIIRREPDSKDGYVYPPGPQALGWMIELFPVFVVLVFSVYRLAKAASKGELGLALRTFISPTDEWGPREDLPSGLQNKAFEEISPSFRQIDPI